MWDSYTVLPCIGVNNCVVMCLLARLLVPVLSSKHLSLSVSKKPNSKKEQQGKGRPSECLIKFLWALKKLFQVMFPHVAYSV